MYFKSIPIFLCLVFLSGCSDDVNGYYDDTWDVPRNSNIIWDRTIGSKSSEVIMGMNLTSDGGYIVATHNYGAGNDRSTPKIGVSDYWIVKTDANGMVLWERAFGGNKRNSYPEIMETSDGGFLVGGKSDSPMSNDKSEGGFGLTDFWILKLDSNGTIIWDKTIGGTGDDAPTSLYETNDGYIVAGTSNSDKSGNKTALSKGREDVWVVKIDFNGNMIWDQAYGGNNSDRLSSLLPTSDGGFILASGSFSGVSLDKSQATFGDVDYWIFKLDSDGTLLWEKSFGSNASDYPEGLMDWPDGSYSVYGVSRGYTANGSKLSEAFGQEDIWILNFGEGGNLNWERTLGTKGHDMMSHGVKLQNNRIFLGFTTNAALSFDPNHPDALDYDSLLLELDQQGEILNQTIIAGNNADYLKELVESGDHNLCLVLQSNSEGKGDKSEDTWPGNTDIWMVKMNIDW